MQIQMLIVFCDRNEQTQLSYILNTIHEQL